MKNSLISNEFEENVFLCCMFNETNLNSTGRFYIILRRRSRTMLKRVFPTEQVTKSQKLGTKDLPL